ncbi:glycosyltransferase [Tsukamurella serpentis]
MTGPGRRLRILSVVTLVSPDGAFGGPLSVAINQARALRAAGHEVVLAAGATGYDTAPTEISGVPARLFPAHRVLPIPGYAAMRARGLNRWLRGVVSGFDVVHVHLARDLVTMPAAIAVRRAGVPYVVQTHGMIIAGSNPAFGPIDRIWTRSVVGDARAAYCLDQREADDLRAVLGPTSARVRLLRNGILADERDTAVRPLPPEVLFLARLHPRKGAGVFAAAALELLRRGVQARFRVAGPEEGAESEVDALVSVARSEGFGEDRLRREPPVPPEQVPARMAGAAVFVAPAVREPFGMTIVEALSVGTPVVVSDDGGLADFVRRTDCGRVVEVGVGTVADAIGDLLADPDAAAACGRRGRAAVQAQYGMDGIVADLVATYQEEAG